MCLLMVAWFPSSDPGGVLSEAWSRHPDLPATVNLRRRCAAFPLQGEWIGLEMLYSIHSREIKWHCRICTSLKILEKKSYQNCLIYVLKVMKFLKCSKSKKKCHKICLFKERLNFPITLSDLSITSFMHFLMVLMSIKLVTGLMSSIYFCDRTRGA